MQKTVQRKNVDTEQNFIFAQKSFIFAQEFYFCSAEFYFCSAYGKVCWWTALTAARESDCNKQTQLLHKVFRVISTRICLL